MIHRMFCFFRGHSFNPESPCGRCGSYLSYLDYAARRLHLNLLDRLREAARERRKARARERAWRSDKPCAECGKNRSGCDDCIPF